MIRAGFLVLALVFAAAPALAAGKLAVIRLVPPDGPRSADVPPSPAAPAPDQLALRYQRVLVTIEDRQVVTKVRQTFVNPFDQMVEGSYEFQVPPEASVSDFAIWEGGDRVAGVVRLREDARAIYEAIRTTKRDPGLLEHVAGHVFRAKVFPILPRSDKMIEIEYRESLALEDRLATYRFPLGLGSGAPPIGQLSVTVEIRDRTPLAAVWSPTPGVAVHHHDAHHATAGWEDSQVTGPAELVMNIGYQGEGGIELSAHRPDDEPGYFLLSIAPPTRPKRRPRDVVFTIDTSGSMKGSKLTQARAAVAGCLDALDPADRFALATFSDGARPFAPDLLPAAGPAVERAAAWVAAQPAAGETNLDAALGAALAAFDEAPGRTRYVVLVTDGQPTRGVIDPADIRKRATAANGRGARLFTVGIGAAAGSPLLEALATENRGESIAIEPDEDLGVTLPRLCRKLTTPLCERPALAWKGVAVADVHPKTLPSFYADRVVTAVGRYPKAGAGSVELTAEVDGELVSWRADVRLPERSPEGDALPRLWAQRHVDSLVADGDPAALSAETREQIVQLSVQHRFVTPLTSFIAVPESERRRLSPDLKMLLDAEPRSLVRVDPASPEPAAPATTTTTTTTTAPRRLRFTGEAARHLRLAIAAEKAGGPDAERRVFEHVKAAIREDPRAKGAVKHLLRNSEVSNRIASVVSETIAKSESMELTDAQVEEYARKFEQMLGAGSGPVPRSAAGPRAATPDYRPVDPNGGVGRVRTRRDHALPESVPVVDLPEPPAHPLQAAWRALQEQVAALTVRVALLAARVAAVERLAARSGGLLPYLESVVVEPASAAGGTAVRVALTVRHPAGAAPRVRIRAPAGRITGASAQGATWIVPDAPGVHTLTVELVTPAGERILHAVPVPVWQPGLTTYAPSFLEGRIQELDAALIRLAGEHAALAARLARAAPGVPEADARALDAMALGR